MITLIFFCVCFGASIVGAICGIGGGVIIKPVLDAFGILDVKTISFLSGCTVLSMTTYSVLSSRFSKTKTSSFEVSTGLPLALGGAVGGIVGKWMFSYISALSGDQNKVGLIQSVCLLLITVGTLIYTLFKERVKTLHVESAVTSVVIGLFLGILSSFLGIGGGSINLVVLFYFFSMDTKQAAENSLYIIFFSQVTSLISTLVTKSVPAFTWSMLILMVIGGILGGVAGRGLNKKISSGTVDKLFIGLMVVIICINIYNCYQFGIA